MMDFEESMRTLSRKAAGLEVGMTEEATKMALVVPLIRALGYDVFNPDEVVPEYTASVGSHKDARADYAIMKEGEPFAVIECKALGVALDVHKSQLEWYFMNCPARIGILTDGNRYVFYSDIEEKNKMDKVPFMDFTLSSLDEAILPRLRKLCKDKFAEVEFINEAEQLKYSREFRRLLAEQFAAPDDEFAKLFIARVWNGKVMQSVLDRLKPVLKTAMKQYIDDTVNARLKAAMDKPDIAPEDQNNAEPEVIEIESTIVTTEEEKEAFYLVKSLLIGTVDTSRVILSDKINYCNVLLDGKKTQPIVRFRFNNRPWKINLFDVDEERETKYEIEGLEDIMQYTDRIRAAALKYDSKA